MNFTELSGVNLSIYRHPGATIEVLEVKLNQCEYFDKSFDFIILCIGGNDLSAQNADLIFNKLYNFMRKVRAVASNHLVCMVECRHYPEGNRFNVDPVQFKSKVVRINCKIKRFVPRVGCRFVDMGKTAFTLNRIHDGVHFHEYGRLKFHNLIVKIVRAVLR